MNQQTMNFQSRGQLRQLLLVLGDYPSRRCDNSSHSILQVRWRRSSSREDEVICISRVTHIQVLCELDQRQVGRIEDPVRNHRARRRTLWKPAFQREEPSQELDGSL